MRPNSRATLRIDTKVVHVGVGKDPVYGAVSTPVYQTVTYQHNGEGLGEYDYTRTQNPTRSSLAEGLGELEGASGAVLFASGMAAITAICHLLSAGDHIILTNDVYGGTYRIMVDIFQKFGLTYTFVDTRDPAALEQAFTPHTRLVFIETPSNPLLQITDIGETARIAHHHGAWLAVDNTFMTPLRQRPLDLGADFSLYSATKYLAGHNDVLAGAVMTRDAELGVRVAEIANTTGGVLSPFDSWLVLRGLKTLAVRLDRQEANARAIARFLQSREEVTRVFYPGLPGSAGHDLHARQASGPGAMLSFQLERPDRIVPLLKKLAVILPAVSLGGTESLITHPFTETHREFPEEIRYRLGIRPGLLRLSVGIENPDDLLDDLGQALTATNDG